jgi:hypothetical protein
LPRSQRVQAAHRACWQPTEARQGYSQRIGLGSEYTRGLLKLPSSLILCSHKMPSRSRQTTRAS